jgi:hypothetical protein
LKLIATYRLLTLLLIAVWGLHFAYPVYYAVVAGNIHTAQQAAIETEPEALTRIILSATDFKEQYNTTTKELYYEGKMYDVAQTEAQGDNVLCTVLADEQETCLNQQLSNEVQHSTLHKSLKQCVSWVPVLQFATPVYNTILPHFNRRTNYTTAPDNAMVAMGFRRKIPRPPCA